MLTGEKGATMTHHRIFLRCFVVLLLSASFSTAGAQALYHSWSQSFGGWGPYYGESIATDASGNVVVTGYFSGSTDFGGGPLVGTGLYVAKFDAAGNHLWSQRFGDSENSWGRAIATDASGNVVVTGSFGGVVDFGGGPLTSAGGNDVFVAKFDAAGNHLWSRRFGDGYSQKGMAIAADALGNVVVTGDFGGVVDFGGGPLTCAGGEDIFVAKFDAVGNHIWSQSYGDVDHQYGRAIATDASGNAVVTGYFLGTVDFGGGPLTCVCDYGDYEIFLAKFDAAGNHLWSQRFEGYIKSQFTSDIVIDSSGDVVLAGHFGGGADFGGGILASAGYSDIFIAKFDAAGNHLWSQRFGDEARQKVTGLAIDASDNAVVTGDFHGTVDFGGGPLTNEWAQDIYIAKFDAAGNHIWSQNYGEVPGLSPYTDQQYARAIATDASGNVVVTGFFYGTVDFGGGPLYNSYRYHDDHEPDIFVAKFEVQEPVPTMLQAFDAVCNGDGVELTWRLSEIGWDARFFVLRSEPDLPFAELHAALMEVDGLNGAFADRAVEPGKTYRYRVDVSDEDGRNVLFTTQEITVPVAALTLGPVQPNPFNPQTTIQYTVPGAARVRLGLYDTKGTLVRTLVDGAVPAGARVATWNGRDARGAPVSSGVYFVRLESGGQVRTSKIVLLK